MVRVSRRLAPLMAERQWGRIINMASTIGLMPDVNMAAYAVTKAAMHNLTVALSRNLGTRGVTVNAISPGLTNSAGVQYLLQMMVEAHGWPSEPAQLGPSAHRLPIQWDAWAASKKLPVWWPLLQAPLRITSTEAICGSMAAWIQRLARREIEMENVLKPALLSSQEWQASWCSNWKTAGTCVRQ